MGEPEKKEARLSGDSDADLIGKFQSAAAFPIFFGDKYLDKSAEMSAFGIFQHAIMGNVTADYVLPGGRERGLGELLSTMINNPVKHWNFLCPFASFQNSSFCDCTMKKRLPNAGGLSNRYVNKVL
jgi:hypothetical protein